MNRNLQLVLVGAGLVGKRHVRAISMVNGVELAAIVDLHESAQDYAHSLGVPLFENLQDAFEAQSVDGVILATPTPLHVEQAELCIAQGVPVLIEKPIAVSAEAARAMVVRAEDKNLPILVGHHRRHNPIIQAAYDHVQAGEIGDIRAIHVNCWFYKPDHYFDEAPWRKKNGAVPISVNLVHDVDLIRFLAGEIVNVQAQSVPSRRGYENEDVAAAILRFESGALATITVSDAVASPWSWELTSGEYPIYPKTQESCYLIGGSQGSLSVPDLRLWKHGKEPDWWSPIAASNAPCSGSDPLVNQMAHFAKVIEGKEAPLVSGWEGLRTLEVIEAIQKSAKTGEAVAISPMEAPKDTRKRA